MTAWKRLALALLLVPFVMADRADAQRVWDRFQISNPVLSSDGKLLAFDFFEVSADQLRTSPRAVAIYDIAAEHIELLVPPAPRAFHSPSFSADDQFLALIQHCWDDACSEAENGLQVGIVHLPTKRFRRLTTRENRYKMRRYYLREGQIAHGYPVFGQDGEWVYFSYRSRPGHMAPGSRTPYPNVLLGGGEGRMNGIGRVNIRTGQEELHDELSDLRYVFGGFLTSTVDGIYFYGNAYYREKSRSTYEGKFNSNKTHDTILLYDPETKEVSSNFSSPPYFPGQHESSSNYQAYSLRASKDGRRLVFRFYRFPPFGPHDRKRPTIGMYVMEDRKPAQFHRPLDGRSPGEVAISGDGKLAVMTGANRSRSFWVVDLETRQTITKPLATPLLDAIARSRR